jgi:hypothetical protein
MSNKKPTLKTILSPDLLKNLSDFHASLLLYHNCLHALILIQTLDSVWNDPFKNPEDVDKILEQWRKHKTNLKKEPLL